MGVRELEKARVLSISLVYSPSALLDLVVWLGFESLVILWCVWGFMTTNVYI